MKDGKMLILLFLTTIIEKASALVKVEYCPSFDITPTRREIRAYAGSAPSATVGWNVRATSPSSTLSFVSAIILDPERSQHVILSSGRTSRIQADNGQYTTEYTAEYTGDHHVDTRPYHVSYIWCDESLQSGCANRNPSCCSSCTFQFRIYSGSDPSNPCAPSPCLNGGGCSGRPGNDPSYQCTCANGYTGRNCEVEVVSNLCFPNPCQNGGACLFGSRGNYMCRCAPGYTGTNCEIYVNVCSPNPCQNGGTCYIYESQFGDNYSCACTPENTGTNCEISVGIMLPLNPEQKTAFMNNYRDLLRDVPMTNGIFDAEMLSQERVYNRSIIPELTEAQEEMLLEIERTTYPYLFFDRDVIIPRNVDTGRRRRQTGPVSRICDGYYPEGYTELVSVSPTDRHNPGHVNQVARVNNRIQWVFNEECMESPLGPLVPLACKGIQFSQQCQCYKERQTVSALVYNIQLAAASGMNNIPMQWKTVEIYSCRGGR